MTWYFVLLFINCVICDFVEGLVGYDNTNDKWYSIGLFFKWPNELGKYIRIKIFE